MNFKVATVFIISLIIQVQGSLFGYYGPFGPGGPYGGGGIYGPGGPYGIGGPFGPGGPYGGGGPYGPGGPFGVGGPYGPGGLNGPGAPAPFGSYGSWSSLKPTKPSIPEARQTRSADAKASIGFGLNVPFLGFQQQLLSSKFSYLSQSMYLRSLYTGTVNTLNNDLEMAKYSLTTQLDSLIDTVESTTSPSEDRDVSKCITDAKTAIDNINTKIETLEIDLDNSEAAQQIKGNISSLHSQIGQYGRAFGLCKAQFKSFLTSSGSIQQCMEDQQQAVNTQVENLTNTVTEDIETLEADTTEMINSTVNEVEESINLATSNLDNCLTS